MDEIDEDPVERIRRVRREIRSRFKSLEEMGEFFRKLDLQRRKKQKGKATVRRTKPRATTSSTAVKPKRKAPHAS
jgi:hypothetical protein